MTENQRSGRRMAWCGLVLAGAALLGGCPGGSTNGVNAEITISSASGPAPHMFTVSGAGSTSTNGAVSAYAWDFDGEGTSDQQQANFVFATPGRHRVTLTVSDDTGETDSTGVDVRVQGGPAVADIVASVTSGEAPLSVQFDATGSTAEDDVIEDFSWDFGDGDTALDDMPTHTFTVAGTYTVSLLVTSAGGVEDTAEITISVAERNGGHSLQFNGSQSAALPVTASGLNTFTIEAYAKADSTGGTLLRFGTPVVTIELLPNDNLVRVRAGVLEYQATVSNLDGDWRYFALVNDPGGATIYVDGEAVGMGSGLSGLNLSSLTLGSGYRGNATAVRVWSTARTAAQVTVDMGGSVSPSSSGLLADWPIDEGSGQTLNNRVSAGTDGTLGVSSSSEASDPAWSNDAP